MQERRPAIPDPMKRELRQEAYFGCVRCGNPIIDYHHIIPYANVKKHEKKNLVVLCPNCHRMANNGMYDKEIVLEDKANPHNKKYRYVESNLILRKYKDLTLNLGGIDLKNVKIPLQVMKINLIYFNTDEKGRALLNAVFFDSNMQKIAEIIDNEWKTYIPDDMWDIQYSPGHLKINLIKNKIFLELKISGNTVTIKTSQFIFGNEINIKDEIIEINGRVFKGCEVKNSTIGIHI